MRFFICGICMTVVSVIGFDHSFELAAAEPITLENVTDPGPNSPDEPIAEEFSLERAVRFMDAAALTWQKERRCFTCHTNYAYLMVRPAVSADVLAHQQVRAFAEELVSKRWAEQGPRWDAEVVATAAALALNDRATGGKLHPLTRQALDRMWTVQRGNGSWKWLDCDWPPMEDDDDYGVILAAIATAAAPEDYAGTEAAQAGMNKIRKYLSSHEPPTLHHRAMLVWADSYGAELLSQAERDACVAELFAVQHEDGGWSLPSLGDWKRPDGSEQSTGERDGYGTGFAMFVLRRAGIPAADPRLARGAGWLRSHQRASGRWFTRSLKKDNRHYISHVATAFAVLALSEMGEATDKRKQPATETGGE